MAINFLNTVDLNFNQLNKAAIQNLAADPAAGVLGQIYYNTAVSALKICTTAQVVGGANAVYTEVGATSGVETISIGNANVNAGGVNTGLVRTPGTGIGDVVITPAIYGGASNVGMVPTGGAANKYLDGTGNWVDVTTGDVTEVQGGTYINVTDQTGPIPIVNHDTTSRTNTTNASSPGYGGDIVAIDSITTNTTGHVTDVNTKTYTLPSDTNETYTLPVAAGASNSAIMNLTAGGTGSGIKSSVTVLGTTGRIAISEQTGNNGSITVDFPDDVTIVDDFTVGGVITQSQANETNSFASPLDMNNNKLTEVKTGTLGTDGVNLAQVEALVAGLGSFQGGYNATTNSPALSGASNVAVGNGDFYVVTTAGTLFTKVLEVGDFIFANTNIAADSSPSESDYIFVISDANIAGAGATDGATQKGVAGFDSANFDVSASGWVQLNSQRNAYGATQTLDNTSPVARVESGGLTTFTIDLADASLFGTGALAKNVTAEVTQNVSPYQTVYADVTRSGSASMSIVFSGSVAVDIYRVLLSHI